MNVEATGTAPVLQGGGAGAGQAAQQQAEAARAMQEALAAQQTAQQAAAEAAREAARAAAQAGQEAAQEGQRAAERARRDIERAIRDAQREARAGRAGQQVVFPPFPGGGPQIPDGAVIISVAFFVMCAVIAIGFPIARAMARRMDRRSAGAPVTDSDTRARLERIEQAVDAIAVEVERVSEGQRFTTKMLAESRALPQPDLAAGVNDRVAVPLTRAREAR